MGKSYAYRQGFTLIELSIVLVIIGLLAAGVLVGRDLIEAARVRAQIDQFNKYETALKTFKIKFNCIPGDCRRADEFGLGDASTNGNGNGLIESPNENPNFWHHFSRSNLIEGNYTPGTGTAGVNFPPLKIDSGRAGGIVLGNYDYLMGRTMAEDGIIMTAWKVTKLNGQAYGGFRPMEAMLIDQKMDDGLPMSGNEQIPLWMTSIACGGPPFICTLAGPMPNRTQMGDADACIDDSVNPPVYFVSSGVNRGASCEFIKKHTF